MIARLEQVRRVGFLNMWVLCLPFACQMRVIMARIGLLSGQIRVILTRFKIAQNLHDLA
jgi:hypothetical protein